MVFTGEPMIQSSLGVLAVLFAIAAFYFFLHQKTGWRVFNFFPPLLWIYATPVILNNVGVLPATSTAYGVLSDYVLPVVLCLLLLSVDVGAAIRVMGKGVAVMLLGTTGVILGGALGYFVVHRWLIPDAWTAFGALAGSWIGGTGNMAAVATALDTSPEGLGLAVLADNVVYVVWLPLLLGSKSIADRFNRWAKVPADRIEQMESALAAEKQEARTPQMRDYLYLGCIGLLVAWVASSMASQIPEFPPVLSTATWKILLITTLAIGLSATPLRGIPGSHELAMALIYVFVAGMGARASLSGFAQAPAFLLGSFIWIAVHGAFCLAGARLFRIDVHSAAIASAANIGGAASATVVAAYHRESLVPAAVLMSLIGYAMGNYLAILTAQLCRWVGLL